MNVDTLNELFLQVSQFTLGKFCGVKINVGEVLQQVGDLTQEHIFGTVMFG